MKYFSSIVFTILLFTISCSNDKSINNPIINDVVYVSWEGDYASDGCGFFIYVNEKKYKPSNEETIGNEFKTYEQSSAKIKYSILQDKISYPCHESPSLLEMYGIEIISIEKIID